MGGCLLALLGTASNCVAVLPPVVVEATRLDQSSREIAAHVEVIDRETVASSGAQSTAAVLEKCANVFFRTVNANPSVSQVSMRGYGANSFGRVKILVDGEELNNPDMAPQELNRVPVRSIDCIEVLYGPQTVLHGGEASAGVINILTGSDSFERKTVLDVHGGSWGTVGTHVGTRGGFESSGTTYFADFDYDRSDGWRDNTQSEVGTLKGGVRQHFDNGGFWGVKVFGSASRYGLPGGLYTGLSTYGVDYGGWKERADEASDLTSEATSAVGGLMLSGRGVLNDDWRLDGSFSYRRRDSSSYADYAADTFDWKLSATGDSRLFGRKNRFILGTDLKLDVLDVSSDCDNDYSRFGGAVFARDEFGLLDAVSVFGGVRGAGWVTRDAFTRAGVRASERASRGEAAGEAGVNVRPVDDMKVFARWSHFYHAPLADEMFSYYGVPNLDLEPETGDHAELGADWTLPDGFALNATVYHTELNDEILYLKSANCNAPDRTRRDGAEASFTWERAHTGSAGIRYGYVWARFAGGEYDGNDLPLVPRQLLRIFGEYFLWDELAVRGGFRFVGEQRYGGDFDGVGGTLPGYGLFDVGFRVMPTWGWLDGFTFALTVDNLFDKRYADYGEYVDPWYVYPAAGRTFLLTVRYEF